MIQNFVYIHAVCGGIALLSGLVALIVRKGSLPHIISGLVFFWSMLLSAIIAMVVATLPGHTSPFLFAVGVFSIYLITTGYLAVRYKKIDANFTLDKILAFLMIITAVGMIIVPIIVNNAIHIILTVFGCIGGGLAIQDLMGFRNPEKLRKNWLQAHLGKMIGGYISATTAFVVVNQFFTPLIGWLGPTVIGVPFIIYWTRKVSKS